MCQEPPIERGLPASTVSPEFIASLPKAELHLHLEGTVTPETWLRLLKRRDNATKVTLEELRERMRFRDLHTFFEAWMALIVTLKEPDDFRIIARECGRQLAAQNVRYAELHTSVAGAQQAGRLNADEVLPAIAEGLDEARREGGPEWRLIVDIIRDLAAVGDADIGLNIALNHARHGVVAVGLGGSEHLYEAGWAREAFSAAIAGGLHATAHAGEGSGPESIRAALDIGAERIGHAARAVEDPTLVKHLMKERIPLEMCPTSNVCTGAVRSIEEHPVGRFLREGMVVSLSTDDPAFFGTSLNDEYLKVAKAFSLSESELITLARNAFEGAFVSESEKERLLVPLDTIIASIC